MSLSSNFTVGSLARRNAKLYPQKAGIVSGEKSLTFFEFNGRVNKLANSLLSAGVKRGDRIGTIMPNTCQYLEIYFSAAKIGAIVVPINLRLTPSEVTFILRDADVGTVVAMDTFLSLLQQEVLPQIKNLIVIGKTQDSALEYESFLNAGSCDEPIFYDEVNPEDTLLLIYTSGTTGNPKGCMLNHKAIMANNFNLGIRLLISPDDCYLNALPLFHMVDLGFAFAHFHIGAVNVLMPVPEPPLIIEMIQQEKVTCTVLVPNLTRGIMDYQVQANKDIGSLRFIIGGGGMESQETLDDIKNILKCGYIGVYGQTECGNVMSMSDYQDETDRPGTCGRPLANFEWRLVDDKGRDVPVDEPGELLIKGPSVMQGYWKRSEATREALAGEWLHTGDILRQDKDGYLYMMDRKKDLVKTGGLNVYPKEVEVQLMLHPAVKQAVVVGVPDAKWYEAIKAFIVLKEGHNLTTEEVNAWCREKLASYKRPRWIEFVREIPVNQTGKVLKRDLRKQPLNDDQRVE